MLTFPIKKKWFDMIKSGEKHEEYRDITDYYDSRLMKFRSDRIAVCFRNGYRADSPEIYCEVVPVRGYTGRQDWGAEPYKEYWVLVIMKVLESEEST